MSKLVPVVGNVRDPDLAIDADVAQEIRNEVNIVVNSAATTDFRERLIIYISGSIASPFVCPIMILLTIMLTWANRYDVAIDINTRGPSHLLGFAKKCKKLDLFVHVSTGTYCLGKKI